MNERKLPSDVKREILIKSEAETSPDYGCPPIERPIEEYIRKGVINLDKPAGPTSHEVVSWVKKILNLKKAGHGGTLDPKVTGILPIALEDATKIIQSLLPAGKEYVTIIHLHGDVPEEKIKKVIKEFEGPIYQRPPVRASVKRRLRIRNVYYIDILEIESRIILLRIGCQAGTYIRKIAHDIGEALGVGAHMGELRRTRTGPFKEDETLVTLHDVVDAYHFWKEDGDETFLRRVIQPMEKGLEHLPHVWIRDSAVDAICHGANLAAPGIVKLHDGIKPGDLIAIFTLKNEAVALGKALVSSKEMLEKNHGIVVDTERVLMERGTYPSWYEFKKEQES
ncbi:MAG: RNA-guided pseudouridylation complex pseudouridine synthase subunit Cbf5 [Candidatus Baldrarchaeia archaeon]